MKSALAKIEDSHVKMIDLPTCLHKMQSIA